MYRFFYLLSWKGVGPVRPEIREPSGNGLLVENTVCMAKSLYILAKTIEIGVSQYDEIHGSIFYSYRCGSVSAFRIVQ